MVLLQNASLHSANKKTPDKPKLKDILLNNWSVLSKKIKVMKDKERLRRYKLDKTEKKYQLNVIPHQREMSGTNGKILKGPVI